MRYASILTAALLLVTGHSFLNAQGIDDNIVDVTGHHRPIIRDAEKMNLRPEIDDTATVTRSVDISIDPTSYTVAFVPKEIKPAKLGSKSDIPLKKAHAIAGFGNYMTPYGEFFYNTGRSRTHQSGLHIRHLSSSGDIDGYGDAAFSQNDVAGYTHIFTRHAAFHGKVSYDRDMVHFYGYQPDSFPTIDFSSLETRQVFHVASGKFGVDNLDDHAKVYYDFSTGYSFLGSLDTLREHLVNTEFSLFAEPDILRAAKDQKLGFDMAYQFRNSGIDTSLVRRDHLFAFKPYLEGIIDEFDIHAGIAIWLESDSGSRFRVFPDIHASLNLLPGTISLYAGLSGGIHQHTYTSYSKENPFISRDIELGNSIEKMNLHGGVRFALGRHVDGVVHLEMANYASMPFFVNDTSEFLMNRFIVAEDEEITVSRIGAELSYRTNDKFRIRSRAYHYGYSMTHLQEAWHKPGFEWNTSLDYNLRDKIIASVEVTFLSGIKARSFSETGTLVTEALDPVTDINVVLEYRFNKAFAAFIQGNNLLGQRQYMFYDYPSQGIRVLGGVSYSL